MEENVSRKPSANVCLINPFECRMWHGHARLPELVTEESCREEIESFRQHGQRHPVLGRPIRGDSQFRVELMYGARRLFVAQHLNAALLVELRELDDRQAFIEMDIENRLRRDISPYERGMAYKDWLRQGYFHSQKDIATAFGISCAQVSRLLRFAELPAVVVRAFGSQADMKESWAITLADRCKDPAVRLRMTAVARTLEPESDRRDPAETFKLLLDCEDPRRRSRLTRRDTIVRSAGGDMLFRISYRHNEVHIVVPRERAGTERLEDLTQVLRQVFEGGAIVQHRGSLRQETGYLVTAASG